MMSGTNLRRWFLLSLIMVFTLGCTTLRYKKGVNVVKITTEPERAKVIFSSLDTGITNTYFSPAEFSYDPTLCYNPSLIVESGGYRREVIHLKPELKTQVLHVVLEKVTDNNQQKTDQKPSNYEGVPSQLEEKIPMWMPNISEETPAFDPSHQ